MMYAYICLFYIIYEYICMYVYTHNMIYMIYMYIIYIQTPTMQVLDVRKCLLDARACEYLHFFFSSLWEARQDSEKK